MFWKERTPKLNGDLTEKIVYISRVISTCKTPKQLYAAYTWGYRVIKNLEEQDEKQVEKLELAYEWTRSIHERYRMYYRVLETALDNGLINMTNEHAQDKEHKA